jgi:hypothetical protein
MASARGIVLGTIATAAVALATFPSPCGIASASEPEDLAPVETDGSVALYISLCLWSQQHPSPTCRDVPLTPGAAGPAFISMKACQAGQEDALRKWRAEAGPVFGFTAMAGDGYRIDGMRCSLIASSSPLSEEVLAAGPFHQPHAEQPP